MPIINNPELAPLIRTSLFAERHQGDRSISARSGHARFQDAAQRPLPRRRSATGCSVHRLRQYLAPRQHPHRSRAPYCRQDSAGGASGQIAGRLHAQAAVALRKSDREQSRARVSDASPRTSVSTASPSATSIRSGRTRRTTRWAICSGCTSSSLEKIIWFPRRSTWNSSRIFRTTFMHCRSGKMKTAAIGKRHEKSRRPASASLQAR